MRQPRPPRWSPRLAMTLTAVALAACSSRSTVAGGAGTAAAGTTTQPPAATLAQQPVPAGTAAQQPAGTATQPPTGTAAQPPAGDTGPADAGTAGARPGGAVPARPPAGPPPKPGAMARLASADNPQLSGTATFTQLADAVRVEVDVQGVDKPGPHGLHLHEVGSCEPGPPGKRYATAGAHFNPGHAAHACPDSTAHHAGDFGNLEVQPDGSGHYVRVTALLLLTGPGSPIGRALVLHRGEDDCKTQPAGNSGERLACGVVEAVGSPP